MAKRFQHPKLGIVEYTFRSNARRYIFRWCDGILHFTIPSYATPEQAMESINNMADELLANKPVPTCLYHIGQTLQFDLFSVNIVADNHLGSRLVATYSNGQPIICVGTSVNLESTEAQKSVSKLIVHIARRYANDYFPKRLAEIAQTLGLTYKSLEITSGKKTLGRCNIKGEICLTCRLATYPLSLIDYVICHELSHLTEMNHSPLFHRLCDSYCRKILNRPESEMERTLKAFKPSLL